MFLCDMPIHTYILSVHKCVYKVSCFLRAMAIRTYILSVHNCVCNVSCFFVTCPFAHTFSRCINVFASYHVSLWHAHSHTFSRCIQVFARYHVFLNSSMRKYLGSVVFWQLNWEHPLKHYLSKRTNTYLHLVDLFSHSCVSNRCSSKTTWPFSRNNWILNRWNISLVGLLDNKDSKMQGERTRFGRSQTTWNSHQTKHRQGPLKCWSFRFLFCSLLFSVMFKCNLKAAKHICGRKREIIIQIYLKSTAQRNDIYSSALPFAVCFDRNPSL